MKLELKDPRIAIVLLKVEHEKWYTALNRDTITHTSMNFLCQYYHIDNSCTQCPINIFTEHNMCAGTPFDSWIVHQDTKHNNQSPHKIDCEYCRAIIRCKLAFITMIHEQIEPKEVKE